MQRLADAAYLAFRHRAMMCGVKFRAHHTLPVAGHHKSGHRSQRFSQRRRRAAMQQAKRLMSTGINRHFGFQHIISQTGIHNSQMRHHCVIAGGVQFVER